MPEPHAGPDEVRIRVRAASVNPTDTLVRDGSRAESQQEFDPPYVPGMDVAGVIDEIGEGTATDLAVGDDVMAIVVPRGSHGAYSEHVVVPVESGYVVQLAKADGLGVMADASPADKALVSGFGAEVVARGADVAQRIRTVVPDGVDGLADGALLFAHALPAVRDGGAGPQNSRGRWHSRATGEF